MAFREGLEAFLVIAVLLQFLTKTKNPAFKKQVWYGSIAGVMSSIFLGVCLLSISSFLGGESVTGKLWESLASFIAVLLISTLIFYMIKNGKKIKNHIEDKASLNLTATGIFVLSFILTAREGAEMALFTFAGKYTLLPLLLGVALAFALVLLIHHSLVKVHLKTLLIITLAYLILQAGFLLGYSVHEGISAASNIGIISPEHPIFTKAFDLSKTVLSDKEGIVGLPLFVVFGWYSKPEWIQFILQYVYTLGFFGFWYASSRRKK